MSAEHEAESHGESTPPRILNHFAFFHFTEHNWDLAPSERRGFNADWLAEMREVSDRMELYQIFPTRADCEVMVWSAVEITDNLAPKRFFRRFARAAIQQMPRIRCTEALWGITKPSPYTGNRPARGIDALQGERQPYLILYPFVKTTDWYLLSREARQGMMNEHIRVGRKYPEVDQLLLYSFGLEDQEFVVVYETEDLPRYSELVEELRGCEGRRYTVRDTPIYTSVYRQAEETLALWE